MYSDRTKKYVEALSREGKDFDYKKWLRQVQEEEAQAKRVAAASNSHGPSASKPNDAAKATQTLSPPRIPAPVLKINNVQIFRDAPSTESPLQRRLTHVLQAWKEFQGTRDRNAVYGYLSAVFSIVQHYSSRCRTKKLVRRAFKFAELPFDKNADSFSVIIRCTCEQRLDRKTVSKWSRALRYAAQFKERTPLKEFMKDRGGINACASLYTEHFGRSNR